MNEAPIESDVAGETKEEKTARLNFFSDAVRSGLFASSLDIMEQMQAQAIPDVAACMLTGACQFVAELYEGTATKSGADREAMRQHMLSSIAVYFEQYCEQSVKEALGMAVSGAGKQ